MSGACRNGFLVGFSIVLMRRSRQKGGASISRRNLKCGAALPCPIRDAREASFRSALRSPSPIPEFWSSTLSPPAEG
ncbi:unnamed protein product [Linum trigynum]|uniref:Secreted protein n=1 Tax=Linum trigynum TaxID=586398 RepID=A0AAV2GG24_9ROSI